ncbi:hypothetical protein VSO49_17025 [Myroides odoratimimus]|uniref:hypothetical protein n=1 Tax=Myroides odoratimimus TaxID=76832 RepID=UPI002DBF57F4|nr:hypothetical protein [Myroides odoratimimus]MEC4078040.1 hypothetical protein [Myroides odoratimimus]
MISKSKYSLLLIVTLLVVTIFVASCEKETQEEFYTFDVGFETQGISRGIFLDAQDQVQLYFVRTNNDPYAPEQVHLVRYNYSSTTFEFNVL